MEDADGADGGRTGGLRQAGGQGRMGGGRADYGGRANVGQRRGGRAEGGRMGGLADGMENGGGQHREWRRTGERADGTHIGQTSSRADRRTRREFKRPCTSFPASLSSAQTTRLTAERVCRTLGSALGS